MDLDLSGKPKKDNRMLAIGLAAAAALLLAFAGFSRSWVARPMPEVGFGPLGCHNCGLMFDGPADMSNGEFMDKLKAMEDRFSSGREKTSSAAFAPMGYLTFALCMIAALGLLAAAALAYQKKRPELPMAPTSAALLAIMIALITGCIFVATKPGGAGFVGVSLGFWAFGVGSVVGIAGAQMLAKMIRPVDPDLLGDAMNPEQY